MVENERKSFAGKQYESRNGEGVAGTTVWWKQPIRKKNLGRIYCHRVLTGILQESVSMNLNQIPIWFVRKEET